MCTVMFHGCWMLDAGWMQILVEGRLRTDEWADKATGQPRQAVRVVASQVSTVRPYNATVSFQLPASCSPHSPFSN